MKIIDIRELPDGSVDADVKFTDDEVTLLLNYAINNLLKEHIESLMMNKELNTQEK